VGTGVLWGVSTLCAVVPPAGLYGVAGTGLLWDVSTLCALVPPAGLYGVVGTCVLWDVSTLCAVVPPAGLYGVVGTGLVWGVTNAHLLQLAHDGGAHGRLVAQRRTARHGVSRLSRRGGSARRRRRASRRLEALREGTPQRERLRGHRLNPFQRPDDNPRATRPEFQKLD
jgi:hypothetical protein